jgi:alpha-tubulin suppressor-like RCC1 family protein
MVPDLPIGQVPLDRVRDIRVGSTHIIALTMDDKVWTFGNNSHGQRGFPDKHSLCENLDNETKELDTWRSLPFPKETKIKKIACGKWNTFFVTKSES